MIDQRRVRRIKEGQDEPGPVAFWMSRDQRVNDNWALSFAQEIALKRDAPLAVVFCLAKEFLGASARHYAFMLGGLLEVQRRLRDLNIAFFVLEGSAPETLPAFVSEHKISLLVSDFDPLHIKSRWKSMAAARLEIPFFEVDAHNIVPCWVASHKQEYGAYTFRPKLRKLLPDFFSKLPAIKAHPLAWKGEIPDADWEAAQRWAAPDGRVEPVKWLVPGEAAAASSLANFVSTALHNYDVWRNDPNLDGQSNLSPYLHFGQISAQKVALEVSQSSAPKEARDAFLDELIVRRELSDNLCHYNIDYQSFSGFPPWAKATLNSHRGDRRDYIYSRDEFERAKTHDDLWNAAQLEMVRRGKMHGYMRMYWAKKMLEWTETPEQAQEICIYLNDRYELDGRDPNGYAGIAWSIGGVHDRAWSERPIFGKIRYMSLGGARGKFDVKKYISRQSIMA